MSTLGKLQCSTPQVDECPVWAGSSGQTWQPSSKCHVRCLRNLAIHGMRSRWSAVRPSLPHTSIGLLLQAKQRLQTCWKGGGQIQLDGDWGFSLPACERYRAGIAKRSGAAITEFGVSDEEVDRPVGLVP